MNRNEIKLEYRWNLEAMFESQEDFNNLLQQTQNIVTDLQAQETTFTENELSFYVFFSNYETYLRNFSKLYVYAKMSSDVEGSLALNQQNSASVLNLESLANIKLSFLQTSIISHKEVIPSYLESTRCKPFFFVIEEILRTIPHRLTPKEEQELAQLSDIFNTSAETYASWRMEFKDVDINGEPQFLNLATYRQFLENKDINVRKQAYENFFQGYQKVANPMANLLLGNTKAQVYLSKKRNFESALAASMFDDNAPVELFEKVVEMANVKYRSYFHEYNAFKKEVLNLETLHYYDLNIPLIEGFERKYSIDESFTILKAALAPLSQEYVDLLEKARDERWIDFETHTNKRPGAYSWGSYDSYPYILMNYTSSYDSLSTLAHELGHSMHSYFSRANNRPILANYKIFVAEVASTVNEILLNKYLIANTSDAKEKAFLLYHLLEQLLGTIYRQPMYAQFEKDIHTWIEEEKAVSSIDITSHYANLSKEYFGDAVELDDLVGFGAYYIPHFYYNFYVYKYTLGMSCALSFASKILKGDNQAYLEFLKKGGSMYPIEQLQTAGVDPLQDATYDDAFTFFKETLEEFKEVMKSL